MKYQTENTITKYKAIATNWRNVALTSILLNLALIGGLIYLHLDGKI